MKLVFASILLVGAVAIAFAIPPEVQERLAYINALEPSTVKAGEVVIASGMNLDAANVTEVYIVERVTEVRHKVEIGQQTVQSIKFTVPSETKAGRYSILVFTPAPVAKYVEEPVLLIVTE